MSLLYLSLFFSTFPPSYESSYSCAKPENEGFAY